MVDSKQIMSNIINNIIDSSIQATGININDIIQILEEKLEDLKNKQQNKI